MNDDIPGPDPFVERISGPLRAAEQADASFTERVMSAVRDEAAASRMEQRRNWLLRTRTVRLTPLAGMAAAAALMLAALGAGELVRRTPRTPQTPPVAAFTDTVHVVRFVFTDRTAQSVMLVGAFNEWTKGATPMQERSANGVWSVSVTLPAGRHEYAFVVMGGRSERWIADPAAHRVRDEFGTESSIVSIGGTT